MIKETKDEAKEEGSPACCVWVPFRGSSSRLHLTNDGPDADRLMFVMLKNRLLKDL